MSRADGTYAREKAALAEARRQRESVQWRVFGPDRALGAAVARYRPWLEAEARALAGRNRKLARRLVESVCKRMGEWDMTRFDAADDEYLRRAMRCEMQRVAQS